MPSLAGLEKGSSIGEVANVIVFEGKLRILPVVYHRYKFESITKVLCRWNRGTTNHVSHV